MSSFRALHRSGCFIMPNPWDAGSARLLERAGFPAIASSSAGLAWSLGRPDNGIGLTDALAHLRCLAATVSIPVNADFEDGFAASPEQVAEHVALAAATGIAGLSIEDFSQDPARPIRDRADATARIRAAREALDASGRDVLLTGRCENYLHGRSDLDDTIARLVAYGEAGADCLYAPGLPDLDAVRAVVAAVAPKPVNVLLINPAFSVASLADAGVRRISLGGALARAAWGGMLRAVDELKSTGTIGFLDDPQVRADLDGFMAG